MQARDQELPSSRVAGSIALQSKVELRGVCKSYGEDWERQDVIKDLTLEQYLDSGIGLDHYNHQVRMLSGCLELDAPWDLEGRRISTEPSRT